MDIHFHTDDSGTGVDWRGGDDALRTERHDNWSCTTVGDDTNGVLHTIQRQSLHFSIVLAFRNAITRW